MIYKLDDLFKIESESGNYFMLKFEQESDEINPKTNKPFKTKDWWHYPSFKLALLAYFDKCIFPAKESIDILVKYNEVQKVLNKIKDKYDKDIAIREISRTSKKLN